MEEDEKMDLIEATYQDGTVSNNECDFCMEEPENGLLIEKPYSYIMNGKKYKSVRKNLLYMCLECFEMEYTECILENEEENF
jgi:hypothetical protein